MTEQSYQPTQAARPEHTPRVSVCMATYNGARYVEEQLASILSELGAEDEVVVVDDCSADGTVEVVEAFGDRRIHLIRAERNRGYVRSFEHAVQTSRGTYVLLSDQDDVWMPGRVETLVDALASHDVVASNFEVLGGGPRPRIPRLRSRDSARHLANLVGTLIGYRAYYGCGMGMTRKAAEIFLPIPAYVAESHDLWLAICGNVTGSIAHLDSPTLLRRIHGDNVTPSGWRSIGKILTARVMLARLVLEAGRRVRRR